MDKKVLVIIGLFVFLLFQSSGCIEREITGKAYGSLYINDCGEPKGGWEYTQSYWANFTVERGIGRLILKVGPGLGDRITQHEFVVILKKFTSNNMELLFGSQTVTLEWVEKDDVWGTWDNHYIASFGVNMQEDEILGNIKPGIFPGLMDHYYVELRLPEIS